jgi:hypothetical protein
MRDTTRQPTTLARLEEVESKLYGWITEELVIQDSVELDGLLDDAVQWLQWSRNFLSARRLYHKKRLVKQQMLERMAKTLLSQDELEQIDREAEKQLGNLDDDTEPEATEHEHVAD